MDRKTCTRGTDFQHCCCPSSLSAKSRAHCVVAKIQPSRAWESKNWCQGGSSDVIGTNLCSRSFRKLPVKSAYCRIPCWDWGASARPFVSYARVWFTVYVTCSPAQAAFTLLPSLTLYLMPASLPHASLNTSSLLSFRSLLLTPSTLPSSHPCAWERRVTSHPRPRDQLPHGMIILGWKLWQRMCAQVHVNMNNTLWIRVKCRYQMALCLCLSPRDLPTPFETKWLKRGSCRVALSVN